MNKQNLNKLKILKQTFKIMSAEEARKKIEEKIFSDPEFINFSESLIKDLENAIVNKNNKIIFKRHHNENFNRVLKNILLNKGYTITEDVITKYRNKFNDYDPDYTETKVFIIEF